MRLRADNGRLAAENVRVLSLLKERDGDCGVLHDKLEAFRAASARGLDAAAAHDDALSAERSALARAEAARAREGEELRTEVQAARGEAATLGEMRAVLEGDNARLRGAVAEMRARHEEELARFLFDLKEVQKEFAGAGAVEEAAAALRAENGELRAALGGERDEVQILQAEVERLQTYIHGAQLACEKNERLETELKSRPVLTAPSPFRSAPVVQAPAVELSAVLAQMARPDRPGQGLGGEPDSLLSPGAAARMRKLSEPVAASRGGRGAAAAHQHGSRVGGVSSTQQLQQGEELYEYKRRTMTRIDECLGYTEQQHHHANGGTILQNPLDRWG